MKQNEIEKKKQKKENGRRNTNTPRGRFNKSSFIVFGTKLDATTTPFSINIFADMILN